MIKIYPGRSFTLAALVLTCLTSAFSQQTSSELNTLASWVALDATPGWEHLATDVLLKTMPEWKRDQLGNLILRKGSGNPRRVVACGIDRPGFAVTEITDEGYLRMREVGSLRPHPLWVQYHEGQRIRIITRRGDVPGVVTVKSTHLQRGRVPNAPVATLDDLWIDVGGTSRSDVERLGIRMLDPIVRDFASWTYADFVAGPSAATRVGCAALASASRGEITSGETIFLVATLRSFGQDGLAAALRSLGKVDEITILDEPADNTSSGVSQRKVERPPYLPDSTGLTSLNALAPRTRFSRTLVESVHINDARELLTAVEKAAGVQRRGNSEPWLSHQPTLRWFPRTQIPIQIPPTF